MLFGVPVDRFLLPAGAALAALAVAQVAVGARLSRPPGRPRAGVAHVVLGWAVLALVLALGWLYLVGYFQMMVF